MRLLMVSTIGPRKDGLFARPYNIAKYLGRLQSDLDVTAFSGKPIYLPNVRLTQLPENYYATFKRIPSIALFAAFLAEFIVRSRRNIIYAHQLPNILCSWIAVSKAQLSLPIVGDLHGLASLEMRAWGNTLEATLDRILEFSLGNICRSLVVASEDIKLELVRRGLPSSKVHVVPNCVDPNEFYPMEGKDKLRRRLGLSSDKRIVVFTAPRSFTPNVMAIRLLYEAAMVLEKRSPNILFVIPGYGEVIERKPRNVIYPGYVEDLNSFLNACDIAVAPYPPLAVCGGVRNKILEYWACGLPVVSTPEGARGLNSADGRLPLILTDNDIGSLARNIEWAANNHIKLKELTKRARSLVLSDFNWETQASRLHAILHSCSSS